MSRIQLVRNVRNTMCTVMCKCIKATTQLTFEAPLRTEDTVKLDACVASNHQELSSETSISTTICWKSSSCKAVLHGLTHTHPCMLSG